jgi:transposase InsO family protein
MAGGPVRQRLALLQLKTERTARKVYRTREQARADVFAYIERFYNPDAPSFDAGLRQSDRVRESSKSLGRCP